MKIDYKRLGSWIVVTSVVFLLIILFCIGLTDIVKKAVGISIRHWVEAFFIILAVYSVFRLFVESIKYLFKTKK